MIANSSVRRIFKRGGPGNLIIMKTKRKNSLLRFSPVFGPRLGGDQKKRSSLRFSPAFCPKLGEDQKKRSSLRFSPVLCSNFLPKLQRRGAMPQFCVLLYANYTILATQRGGPLYHAPPKYAPDSESV